MAAVKTFVFKLKASNGSGMSNVLQSGVDQREAERKILAKYPSATILDVRLQREIAQPRAGLFASGANALLATNQLHYSYGVGNSVLAKALILLTLPHKPGDVIAG